MSARARIHAMVTLDEHAETELDQRLDDFAAWLLHGAAESAEAIHQHCHRNPGVCAGCQVRADILDVLRSVADVIGEKNAAEAPTATPTDTNRRARLLHEMAYDGGRWKSGDVAAWYQSQGLTELGVRTARHDLAILRDSGAITQHDEKGVRFYTLNSRKDGSK